MKMRRYPGVVFLLLIPFAIHAQTATWVGGAANATGSFNTAANWSPASVPGAGADLLFGTTSFSNISLNSLPFMANSLSFSGAYPRYFFQDANNTLSIGAGGITLAATGVTSGSSNVDFNNSVLIALTTNQPWTTNGPTGGNLTVNGNISGGFAITLTKAGTGYLALNGNNSFGEDGGGVAVSAGTLYLGQSTSAGAGTIALGSTATLAPAKSEITLNNFVSLASGATLGGSLNSGNEGHMKLNGSVAFTSNVTTLKIAAGSDVTFAGGLSGPDASTAVTLQNGGAALLSGATANVASFTADGAAIGFGNIAALPTTSVGAINGGYVSVVTMTGGTAPTPPTVAQLLTKISNPSAFSGTLGFDSKDDSATTFAPHTYDLSGTDLSGFTNANFKLGTASSAVLTGAITTPGQTYNFGGFGDRGGGLFVKSNLDNHNSALTSVTVDSPNSTGAVGGGIAVIFQGNNTFTGNLTVAKAAAILDSANALPSKNFSLGTSSYVGYTENATGYTNFADFAAHLQSGYTSTSILGLDSAGPIANFLAGATGGAIRTVNDNIDLSSFNPIVLGSATGVTIGSGVTIKAPNDGVLRLVNVGDKFGNFTIDAPLTPGNGITSLVAGMPYSDGTVVLTGNNTFAGGTTLQGGSLLVSNGSALGAGAITVLTANSGNLALGASAGGVTLSNNILVTDRLLLGTGKTDDSGNFTAGTTTLTLNGTISDIDGSHHANLRLTGPTVLNGTSTYSGGTYVDANTTVNSDSGLGTLWVDVGHNATLTFTSANPAIFSLSDKGNFVPGGGSGNVVLGAGVSRLGITGTITNAFSGVISGPGGLTKSGTGTQILTGANSYTGATTLSGGILAVSSIANGGLPSGIGAASNAAANLVFDGGTLQYTGATASTDRNFTIAAGKVANISVTNSSSSLTMSGASTATSGALTKTGTGTLILSAAANLHTGATTVSGGRLYVNGSLAGSTVNVLSGGLLGGTGTLGAGATINSGAHLAPGRLAPDAVQGPLTFTNGLTLLSGAILDFEFYPGRHDEIVVNGGTLSGLTSGSMTLNLIWMGSPSDSFVAGTYTLFDFTNATNSNFGPEDFIFGTPIPGFSASLAFAGTTLVLNATAVPEPSAYVALAGLGVLGFAAYRRRRKQTA